MSFHRNVLMIFSQITLTSSRTIFHEMTTKLFFSSNLKPKCHDFITAYETETTNASQVDVLHRCRAVISNRRWLAREIVFRSREFVVSRMCKNVISNECLAFGNAYTYLRSTQIYHSFSDVFISGLKTNTATRLSKHTKKAVLITPLPCRWTNYKRIYI